MEAVEVKPCAPCHDTFRFLKQLMFISTNETLCRASQLQSFFGKVNKNKKSQKMGLTLELMCKEYGLLHVES